MATPIASLTVQKILPYPPAEAFRAWTVPELFQQWFIPMPEVRATATIDLRLGGKYQISFWRTNGQPTVIVNGEFLAIEVPRYLEYTWAWVETAAPGAPNHTVVKVTFRDLGKERTEIVLTHEGFTDPEDRDGHNKGWSAILENMAAGVGTGRPGS